KLEIQASWIQPYGFIVESLNKLDLTAEGMEIKSEFQPPNYMVPLWRWQI
ncbi:10594_t:CDS:1, partial [Entrophospora sp. SA101]